MKTHHHDALTHSSKMHSLTRSPPTLAHSLTHTHPRLAALTWTHYDLLLDPLRLASLAGSQTSPQCCSLFSASCCSFVFNGRLKGGKRRRKEAKEKKNRQTNEPTQTRSSSVTGRAWGSLLYVGVGCVVACASWRHRDSGRGAARQQAARVRACVRACVSE